MAKNCCSIAQTDVALQTDANTVLLLKISNICFSFGRTKSFVVVGFVFGCLGFGLVSFWGGGVVVVCGVSVWFGFFHRCCCCVGLLGFFVLVTRAGY